jgi:uncharacterized protein YcfJ
MRGRVGHFSAQRPLGKIRWMYQRIFVGFVVVLQRRVSPQPTAVGGGATGDAVGEVVGTEVGDATSADVVGEPVGTDVGDSVGVEVGVASGDTVDEAVGTEVGDAIGAEVGEAVDTDIGETVGEAIGEAVGDAIGEAVGDDSVDGSRRKYSYMASMRSRCPSLKRVRQESDA